MAGHSTSIPPPNLPLVSIILLNYNGAVFLTKTLTSVLHFDYPNYECIVVDNGSTDDSLVLLRQQPGIRLIENGRNLGTSRGRNIGARLARGTFLLFLDNDILVNDVTVLARLVSLYGTLKNPAFMNVLLIDEENLNSGKTIYYGGYYGASGIRINKPTSYDRLKTVRCIETANSFTGALFIKSEVWNSLGGFDETQPFNLDDDEISLRAKILGFSNYTFTESYFVHLGKFRRVNNSAYRWKYRYYYSGKISPMIKYFAWKNVLRMLPLFFINTLIKTIVNVLYRRDILLFWAFIYSFGLSIRQLPHTLRERRRYQRLRRSSDSDVFNLRLYLPRP